MKTLLISLSLLMASANAFAGNKEITTKGKRAARLFKQLDLEAQKKERNGKTFLVKSLPGLTCSKLEGKKQGQRANCKIAADLEQGALQDIFKAVKKPAKIRAGKKAKRAVKRAGGIAFVKVKKGDDVTYKVRKLKRKGPNARKGRVVKGPKAKAMYQAMNAEAKVKELPKRTVSVKKGKNKKCRKVDFKAEGKKTKFACIIKKKPSKQ